LNAVIEKVIRLLYTARFSFKSITATLRYRADEELFDYARARWMKTRGVKPLVAVSPDPQPMGSVAANLDYRWQVWWDKPWFWRMDRVDLTNHHVTVNVIDREKSLSYLAESGHVNVWPFQATNERDEALPVDEETEANNAAMAMAFLDPSFLLSTHSLHYVEETRHASRLAYRLWGRLRAGREVPGDALFWESADYYELWVDAGLGILLAYTAYLENRPFAEVKVEELAVDVAIPEEIRSFGPPEGTTVRTWSAEEYWGTTRYDDHN